MFETVIQIEDNLATKDVQEFASVATDAVILYAKKNHDYGNSFDKGMDDIGEAYGIGRIYDKVNRLVTLTKPSCESKAITDETLDDTLMDLACYSIMLLKYRKSQRIDKTNDVVLN